MAGVKDSLKNAIMNGMSASSLSAEVSGVQLYKAVEVIQSMFCLVADSLAVTLKAFVVRPVSMALIASLIINK